MGRPLLYGYNHIIRPPLFFYVGSTENKKAENSSAFSKLSQGPKTGKSLFSYIKLAIPFY
ncbi:hypothetical protein B7C51_03650 [Paenibacillus larvae subsp. pulvifaciens]|uniref:Uncharacterized protein n=1 Tax=Paenibacillus larvae subsp. pulvifaciens TaxID=1477 RepID=A0A1V0UPA2_9BACL|nr:hypothetical protein B7C51_03650 [Paenibacillus larvae subsp. pulvifaciens]